MAADTLDTTGLTYNSKFTAITVASDYSSATLKASDYASSVVTITAATRTKALNVEGNAKANRIIGTSANDTLNGAAGNDTLTGGDGADIFIYDGKGADVITDYATGEDTLKISSGSVSSYTISGSDATFKIGSGSVKVSGGKNKAITVVDSKNKVTTYDSGLIYDGTVAKAKAMTVSAAYGNTLASYGASVVTIDSSARTKALNITGNAAANKITGTSANDTINGGAGNDTLTGGKGKDLFVYESGGGNDLIYDYTAGQDTIKISGDSVSAYSISGSDAVLKVGTGSIKVRGGKTAAVLVVDDNKKASLYQNGAIYNAASSTKATAITLTSGYSNSFTAGTSAISVDASPRTSAINITGNTKNNFLVGGSGKDIIDGGKGADSITGGKGADVLTGGAGADVFIYNNGDGGDVITDYVAGEDVIKITSGEVKSYSVKNGDAILKIGSGAITLKGAGTDAVSVLDENDVLTVYRGGLIYNQPDIGAADVVTITSDYDGKFNSYGASVETIDASSRSKALEIVGNTGANYILGTKGKDTIDGGKGADTIIGGKGNDLLTGGRGDDVFYFSGADGNDTIMDYGAGDIVSLDGASLTSYSTKGNDAVLKIGTGNVTLKDAADIAVTIVGEGSMASIASGGKISTQKWTGLGGGDTVYVTLPAETITVGGGETVTVNETIEVTLPAETITVGGGETVTVNETVEVTLPAETITIGGGETVTVNETVEVTLPAETITVGGDTVTVTVYGGDTVEPVTLDGETVTLEASRTADFTLSAYNATASVPAVNIDGSALRNAIWIYGDDKSNVILSGLAGGTIRAGKGNDVIYCGRGTDYIYYLSDEGNETIYNYKTGDQIVMQRIDQYDDTTFKNISLGGNDVIINYTNGNTITLKDAKDQRIRLLGYTYDRRPFYYSANLFDYNNTFGKVTISGGTASLDENYRGEFVTSQYAASISNVDASSVKNSAINIYANDSANVIHAAMDGGWVYAYGGNDTIYGAYSGEATIRAGAGDDVIYCGRGTDYIYYLSDEGNETIYNYKTGDQIVMQRIDQYDDTTFKNISLSGNDVIINYTNGNTITLKDAKEQRIRLLGYTYDRRPFYYSANLFDYNNTFGNLTLSGGTASLDENYRGEFVTSQYAASISNVDASAVKNSAINIYANDSANEIHAAMDGGWVYAYGGNDTIYGAYSGEATIRAGAGDDVIYCGRGTDYIYYLSDEGNETIYNYKTGDQIAMQRIDQYDDTTLKNISLSGNDVIINYTNGNTITLKDAKEQRIRLLGYTYDRRPFYYSANLFDYNNTAENIIASISASNGNAAVPWFAEDDTNFTTTADLDTLIDTGAALTDFKFDATPADIFAQDDSLGTAFNSRPPEQT